MACPAHFGGGAIIAPFCVAVFHLPDYTIAGAALLGDLSHIHRRGFFCSVLPANGGFSTSPDRALGFLFGLGGFAGMYLGAQLQKYVPQKFIKLMFGFMIISVAFKYIVQFF